MDLTLCCALDADTAAQIAESVAGHATLAEVIRYAAMTRAPRFIERVVVQDEFTHDVVVPLGASRGGLYLVYDTT